MNRLIASKQLTLSYFLGLQTIFFILSNVCVCDTLTHVVIERAAVDRCKTASNSYFHHICLSLLFSDIFINTWLRTSVGNISKILALHNSVEKRILQRLQRFRRSADKQSHLFVEKPSSKPASQLIYLMEMRYYF